MRSRPTSTILAKPFKVELDRFTHVLLGRLAGPTGCHTTREIWRVGREPGPRLLDDDEVSHGFSPACLNILFKVPGAKSSPGLPATVTTPDLRSLSQHPLTRGMADVVEIEVNGEALRRSKAQVEYRASLEHQHPLQKRMPEHVSR